MIAPGENKGKFKKPAARRIGLVWLAVWGVVGVSVAVVAYLVATKSGADVEKEERSFQKRLIAEIEPEVTQSGNANLPVEDVQSAVTNKAPFIDPQFPYTDGRKVISSATNNWNQIIDICIMPNGVRRKVRRNARPPTFDNVSDQIIAVALSGDLDDDLPPIPISEDMELAFVESLEKPIIINDDDSEAIKESKRRVIEAREIIDYEMKKGRGFMEILNDHIAQRKLNAEARETVMAAVHELRDEGDPELLKEYLEKANEYLRDIGVREIDANPRR